MEQVPKEAGESPSLEVLKILVLGNPLLLASYRETGLGLSPEIPATFSNSEQWAKTNVRVFKGTDDL